MYRCLGTGELGIALGKVNEFVWDIVCDWYIEIVKLRLQAGGALG